MKHITIRVAWHDNKWNGKICKNPSENVYCVDNYSLLSSRIQRRRNIEIEEKFKGKSISEVKNNSAYIPPCYWCINILGEEKHTIEDTHPFGDTSNKFSVIPPLNEILKPFSVFTWNFKLSFTTTGVYKYPPDLEDRVKKYIKNIEPTKSVVFLYANYSNPVTGDERKYLVLGAGLVREEIEFPKKYDIPEELYEDINRKMPVFPKIAWQFQVPLDPELTFILPYHEYLQFIERKDGTKREDKEKWLEDITVKVDDPTIIPHFKYVSMYIPHDKTIYLLYKLKKSISKLKEHGVISIEQIESYEKKVDKLLEIAWRERGQYPGFENLIAIKLENEFTNDKIEEITRKLKMFIVKKFGSIDEFLNDNKNIFTLKCEDPEIETAINIIKSQFEVFTFLARFDFSKQQFKNIIDFIGKKGFNNFKANPYSILEEYFYDIKDDDWDIDNNDYGISVYHLDIALIPDTKYANWRALYTAKSLERIRALITLILRNAAQTDGHTYLSRDEIIEKIKDYPLYYIQQDFEIDQLLLSEYESDPRFKEQFKVISIDGQVIYQLKSLEKIERIIEEFIEKVKRVEYDVDQHIVDTLVRKDIEKFKYRLRDDNAREYFKRERTELYQKIFSNKLVVISGKAGSGKTSAIINLIDVFKRQRKTPIFIFTPTGKASLVIRKRLKEVELDNDPKITTSTIHRFIYRELFERTRQLSRERMKEIFKLADLVDKIFDGHYEFINDFNKLARRWQFNPKVVIIDEASMVDEVLLCLLFSLINPSTLQHLIIIGDDKQLPPIGIGRPFIDLIYYLKNQGLESKYCHLSTNLRFPLTDNRCAKIEKLAELFRSDKEPLLEDIHEITKSADDTLEISYFRDANDLKNKLKQIIFEIDGQEQKNDTESLWELFTHIFEPNGKFNYNNLEKIQIITPKRVGKFGSTVVNREIVLEGQSRIPAGTKIICEENQYWEPERNKRILALANGSIGYITKGGYVKFVDIDELFNIFRTRRAIRNIIDRLKKIKLELLNQKEATDIPYTPAYAITVHKSQGSDFDYVVFILSERSSFITRELLYTGFTRAKTKMYVLVHKDLKDELYELFRTAYINSQIELIHTLLFGHKQSPFKPYLVRLKNGDKIAVRSKIEYIIAKTLDSFGIEFVYEPEDFAENHIKPDFKIFLENGEFYWEHLGLLNNDWYKNRWFKKYKIYEDIGITDFLITTSEGEEPKDVESQIRKIIEDLKGDNLRVTDGSYSKHHYVL